MKTDHPAAGRPDSGAAADAKVLEERLGVDFSDKDLGITISSSKINRAKSPVASFSEKSPFTFGDKYYSCLSLCMQRRR